MENNTEALEYLDIYISQASPKINQYLRNKTQESENEADNNIIQTLRTLFEGCEQPKTLYRVLPSCFVITNNSCYRDPAFLSTSINLSDVLPKFAATHGNNALLVINIPKGYPILDVNKHCPQYNDEGEIILLPDSSFYITGQCSYSRHDGSNPISKFYEEYSDLLFDNLHDVEHLDVYYLIPTQSE